MSDPLPWRAWVALYTVLSHIRIQSKEHGPRRLPGNPNGWYDEKHLSIMRCSLDGGWYEDTSCLSIGLALQIPSNMTRTGP